MDQLLVERTVLATGSVQGIGLAIARTLASAGARIAMHGPASGEVANDAVRLIRDSGAGDVRFLAADMRDPLAIDRTMDEVAAWHPIDVLVSNAGIQHTVSLVTGAAIPMDGGWTSQ